MLGPPGEKISCKYLERFSCFSEVEMVWLMLVMALALAEAQDSTPGTSEVSLLELDMC